MGRDDGALYSGVTVHKPSARVHLTPNLFQYAITTGATAALLGATLISMVAAIVKESYTLVMSSGICGVALIHYAAIMAVRKEQWKAETAEHEQHHEENTKEADMWPDMKRDTRDYMVSVLRHSDWAVRRV